MALPSSKQNIIVVLVLCVSYAQALCTCEKTPPSGNCVCQSDNSNPAQCKACVCDHITKYVNGPLVCSCRPGYAVSSINRKKCVDIDECNGSAGNPCQQICTNTVGSYSCSCSPGYTVSGTNRNTCDDIDECNGLAVNPCQQICTNTVGSYSCSCSPGYAISDTNPSMCVDIDECSGTSNPCDDVCTNTIGSYTCSCQQPGYIIDKANSTKCIANYIPCNTDANESTGILISPNYPQNYPPNSDCFWNIPLKPQMLTIINILDFHLQTSSDCSWDYLKIYNGTTTSDPLLYTICGQFKPDPISSPYNLYLKFRSDYYESYKGFKLIYTYDTDECNSPINPCHKTCTNTDGNFTCFCQPGYIIDSTNPTKCKPNYLPVDTTAFDNIGLITTPNYPLSYTNYYTCFWTIPSKPQMLTTISFVDFYLEREQNCMFDSLKIFNGTSTSDPMLQVYCGHIAPEPITSYSDLHLVFLTDWSFVYRGFKLMYTYEKDECSNPRSPCHKTCTNTNGMYTCTCQPGYLLDGSECKANYLPMNAAASDNTGLILTPNYPQWYPYNVNYFWSIPPRSQMITSLRFLDFDVEYQDNCRYDYLKVYNGTSANDPLINVYCGEDTPSPISSTNGLYLEFGSDSGGTRHGFKIAYTYESMPTQE